MTHIWLNVYLYILNYKHVKCKPINHVTYVHCIYINICPVSSLGESCLMLAGNLSGGWYSAAPLIDSFLWSWVPGMPGWHKRHVAMWTHTQAHMGFTTWPLCSIEKTGCLQSFKPETDTSMDLWTKTAKENRKQNTDWNYHGTWQSPPHPLKLHHVVEDFPWGCVASS